MSNPYDAYLETKVLGASPLELLEMLYQAALESVRGARTCLRGKDVLGRSKAISKAQAIVTELSASLDVGQDPNLTRRLVELYGYMNRRLADAHVQQREEPLAEVQKLLETLLDGWRECRAKLEAHHSETEEQAVHCY